MATPMKPRVPIGATPSAERITMPASTASTMGAWLRRKALVEGLVTSTRFMSCASR